MPCIAIFLVCSFHVKISTFFFSTVQFSTNIADYAFILPMVKI